MNELEPPFEIGDEHDVAPYTLHSEQIAQEAQALIQEVRVAYPTLESFADDCVKGRIDEHVRDALMNTVHAPEEIIEIQRLIAKRLAERS